MSASLPQGKGEGSACRLPPGVGRDGRCFSTSHRVGEGWALLPHIPWGEGGGGGGGLLLNEHGMADDVLFCQATPASPLPLFFHRLLLMMMSAVLEHWMLLLNPRLLLACVASGMVEEAQGR